MKVAQKMWNSMRVLKSFSIVEVQHSTGSEEVLKFDTVRKYLAILERAGYLLDTGKGRFKLVKNTGRLAPSIVIKKTEAGHFITDNNLKELVPIKKAQRKIKRTENLNKRLDQIIECFKDSMEFKVTDVMEQLGFDYETTRRDLVNLQRKGIIVCIRKEFGMGGKGKTGVIWVYAFKSKNMVTYNDLIERVKNEVVVPHIKLLEGELVKLNELKEEVRFIKNSKDYEDLISKYIPHLEEVIIDDLCEFRNQFYARENQQ